MDVSWSSEGNDPTPTDPCAGRRWPTAVVHREVRLTGTTAAALPHSVEEYQRYREAALAFIAGRNERIQSWAAHDLCSDEN